MTDLLQYINQIDQSVADAEIDVLESLIQSYDKSIMIITEASDDTDLSVFDIFQEGETWDKFKEDTKAPVFGNKGEGIVKRILMIIPRLIQKLIVMIRKLFTKNKSFEQKMDKDVDNLRKQAKTVVPEQLSEEQAKNLANKINEATKASSQAVAQSERDLKSKRDEVMDSIGKRHEQLREYIRDSEKTFQSKMNDLHSYAKSIDDPFGNSKALEELGKMINDDGPVFKSITPEMVEKIDKKNPGLIDDLLEEVGEKPRKKEKFEDVKIEIQHTTFFGTAMSNDNRMENSQAAAMKIYTDPLINGFDELKSNKYSVQAKKKYSEVLEEIHEDWLDTVDYIINDRIVGKTIYVTFGEVVKVFEQRKKSFENDVKESKKSCDVINRLIKEINAEYDKFNSVGVPGQVGMSQGELLLYLKDVITVLSNIVEMASRCLEGWEMIWNINWNAVQNVLKDDDFKNDTHPTFHMPFINRYTYPVYDGWEQKIRKDLNRWKHTPMPAK